MICTMLILGEHCVSGGSRRDNLSLINLSLLIQTSTFFTSTFCSDCSKGQLTSVELLWVGSILPMPPQIISAHKSVSTICWALFCSDFELRYRGGQNQNRSKLHFWSGPILSLTNSRPRILFSACMLLKVWIL